MLRLLLDTNILIPLEDGDRTVPDKFADLYRIGISNNCRFLVHPEIYTDLAKDKDENRRLLFASKIKKYQPLHDPPQPDEDFLEKIEVSYPIPKVDDYLLYALYSDCVHFLITEDKGIHTKAKRIGLESQVYNLEQCLDAFNNLYFDQHDLPLIVENLPLYNINFNDPIFDSLRLDYPKFDIWFKTKSKEGRKAWIVRSHGYIQGLCIYKEESGLEEKLCNGKVLKLCTLKVDDNSRGARIGELLLKTAFHFCYNNGFHGAYLTTFPEKEFLIDFCCDFGFKNKGFKIELDGTSEEIILYKDFKPFVDVVLDPFQYNVDNYPNYEENVSKYILPIRPEYHQLLFPEIEEKLNPSFWVFRTPAGNAIKKAYISRANINSIIRGELLIFYRSKDLQSVTTIGIVEKVYRAEKPEQIISLVGKRTVYSAAEINKRYKDGGLVILFRELKHLKHFKTWKQLGLKSAPQRIQNLPDEAFNKLEA